MRILLIKMSSMGDVFHAFPALSDALKAKPDLEVDWIVEKDFAEIPQWHPAVKKVWAIELRKWRKNPFKFRQQIKQFFLAINQQDYDLVIDAQGLLKSAWVCYKIKTTQKTGFDWRSAREPLASMFYQTKIKVAKQQHAITRLRVLFAKSLGYEWQENSIINYGLSTDSWLPLAEINKPYCVFLHGTTWQTKLWPEEYWVELASKLEYKNITIVLPWGNEAEKQRSERLNAKICQGWVPQTRLSLNKMAICLKHADFVVSVDTGLSHVSAALGVPMVVLYRVTDPVKIGALGRKVKFLTSPLSSKYIKEFKNKQDESVSLINLYPDDVFKEIQQERGGIGARLYMPSTPFNLLLSFIDASSRGGVCVLVYIDQKSKTPYVKTLSSLGSSPFEEVSTLFAQKKTWKKIAERKKNFLQLDALLTRYLFQEVVVGSDRRIEFQYVMNKLSFQKPSVIGSYLDDGLYSYLPCKRGRVQYFLNSITKKLAYGFWWDEPVILGSSRYIQQSILINPELALPCLKNRKVIALDLAGFVSKPLQGWTEELFLGFKCDQSMISEVDIFFILPHPNDVKKIPNYVKSLEKSIKSKLDLGQKVAVKYHPRFEQEDEFNLSRYPTVELISSRLAFEFIIPFLKENASIIGDFTTVMLTSKMLRKDLDVTASLSFDNAYEFQLIGVMKMFKVRVVENRIFEEGKND